MKLVAGLVLGTIVGWCITARQKGPDRTNTLLGSSYEFLDF